MKIVPVYGIGLSSIKDQPDAVEKLNSKTQEKQTASTQLSDLEILEKLGEVKLEMVIS